MNTNGTNGANSTNYSWDSPYSSYSCSLELYYNTKISLIKLKFRKFLTDIFIFGNLPNMQTRNLNGFDSAIRHLDFTITLPAKLNNIRRPFFIHCKYLNIL